MKIKRICVIAGVPTPHKPFEYTFVDELLVGLVNQNTEIIVIYPRNKLKNNDPTPKKWEKVTQTGKIIKVIMPSFLSLTNKQVGVLNLASITLDNYTRVVRKELKKLITDGWIPDVIYSHFLFPAGLAGAKIGEELSIPVFCGVGEGQPRTINALGANETKKRLKNIKGFIAVSQWVKEMLTSHDITNIENIEVIPNGVNLKKFYPRNKLEMRKKHNLPEEEFIVVFLGRFLEQKGVLRASKAIENNRNVKGIFLGKGEQVPSGNHILFQGPVAHNLVPEFLSAADAFVLPTMVEGCCNSIIEAMACGLPIISSDKSFNDDILDPSCSFRVDSRSIEEITESIRKLYLDKNLVQKMSQKAILKAKSLDINIRAEKIITYMESRIN